MGASRVLYSKALYIVEAEAGFAQRARVTVGWAVVLPKLRAAR